MSECISVTFKEMKYKYKSIKSSIVINLHMVKTNVIGAAFFGKKSTIQYQYKDYSLCWKTKSCSGRFFQNYQQDIE